MITFKHYLLTESIRQGLPHVSSMDHDQFKHLIADKKVHVHNATEKTDGSTHVFGHDEHGFYSQSSGSGSEKMRTGKDYETRAIKRSHETGKPLDLTAAHAFGHAHDVLHKNTKLQNHLKVAAKRAGGEVKVRGELFHKGLARPSDKKHGEVKFVGTSYDPSHMGHVGKIVVHSKLPENEHHDVEHFKHNLSDDHINFDHDKVDHKSGHIDVSDEHKDFHGLNHELIKSRTTKTNKEAKEKELDKFQAIKHRVSTKVDHHVSKLGITPKWGSETEGLVVHPKVGSNAPRFKVTSASFKQYKADPENKEKFKLRNK